MNQPPPDLRKSVSGCDVLNSTDIPATFLQLLAERPSSGLDTYSPSAERFKNKEFRGKKMAGQKNAHHLFALPFFAHIETYVEETNPAAKWCLLGYWHDFQSVPRKIDEFWFADINYPAGLHMTSTLDGCEEFRLKSNETSAPVAAAMENLVVDSSDVHLVLSSQCFRVGQQRHIFETIARLTFAAPPVCWPECSGRG